MKDKYKRFIIFSSIILIWLLNGGLSVFGFDENQDLGQEKGGYYLTFVNNSKETLLIDGIVFWDGSNVGGKDNFSQISLPSKPGEDKIIATPSGKSYFWGYAGNVNGGFDVTRAGYGTKDFSITLPHKQGEFDLDPSCGAAQGKATCPKLQWHVEWNGNGWKVTFDQVNKATGWIPVGGGDDSGMW